MKRWVYLSWISIICSSPDVFNEPGIRGRIYKQSLDFLTRWVLRKGERLRHHARRKNHSHWSVSLITRPLAHCSPNINRVWALSSALGNGTMTQNKTSVSSTALQEQGDSGIAELAQSSPKNQWWAHRPPPLFIACDLILLFPLHKHGSLCPPTVFEQLYRLSSQWGLVKGAMP